MLPSYQAPTKKVLLAACQVIGAGLRCSGFSRVYTVTGPVVGAVEACAADVPDGGEVDGALQAVRAASALAAVTTRTRCILTTASSRGRGQDDSTPVHAV